MNERKCRKQIHSWLPGLFGRSLTLVSLFFLCASGAAAQTTDLTPVCNKTVTADVVAFDQIIFYNRFGSFDPGGMMFALKRDVIKINSSLPLGAGNAQLRADKRPRPIVLRVNEGDCLQVTFTNWLNPSRPAVEGLKFANAPDQLPYFGPPVKIPPDPKDPNGPAEFDGKVHLSQDDTPATRTASMHVNGLDLVGSIASDGSNVGKNTSSLAAVGQAKVYTWYAAKQGQYLLFSTAATSGGEGDGGQITHGLFGTVNVEPPNAKWYRSQVTPAVLAAATAGTNQNGTPKIDYEAVFLGTTTKVLNILSPTNEIIYTDLNAVITGFTEDCTKAPPSGTCGQPFREFSVMFHDELEAGAPAFPEMLTDKSVFSSVKDGFGINYGASSVGTEVLANRKKVGPSANCPECDYEEFFLESWANGDPAVLVAYGPPDPVTGIAKAVAGLFPDDPGNVHHSYLNDPVRFRNVHAGPKETHVFHLHQHQWLQSPRDENSLYLDSQTISPGASFTYEIQYGGGGNRNLGSPGDSIFHCHLYPHFAQGMWELWRNHDVFENGTVGLNPAVGGNVTAGRNLPDGEIAAGIPQMALIPIPGKGLAPMPTTNFEGFPFYMAGKAGHRPSQAPLGRETGLTGGLPRHQVLSGTDVEGPAAIDPALLNDPVAARVHASNPDPFLLGFAKKLVTANLQLLPEDGTAAEKTAIQFHQGLFPGGVPVTTIYDWKGVAYPTFDSSGAAAQFNVNGRAPQPGAPYADPCPDTFVDGNGTRRAVPLRKYRTAWIQFDMPINNAGWHDRQARIAVLEQDVNATLNGTRPPEPLFFRANSGDCIDYRVTNLIPANLNLDDFQVFQSTDIIGQHIHLVKFDVTASDGAGNGWNYESGGFSPEAVRERIAANNAFQQSIGGTQILTATVNPFFGPGVNNAWVGAQTHIERWWADPLLNTLGKDRTLRTVFTHDHFGPSGHQHHGLYAGLVIEPTDAVWKSIDGATTFGSRADGGPTSFASNIIAGTNGANSYREFMMEIADFSIVYTKELQPVSPPNRVEHPLPIAVGSPVVDDPSQQPTPEAISSADPGTQVMNYRNEPIPLRIGALNGQGQFTQNVGKAGDLAYAFSSAIHGDPFTPIMKAYPGDTVQFRLLQGAQEEQHVINIHGHRWLFEPTAPNSGFTNAQAIGISEHFEFLMSDKVQPVYSSNGIADFLYQSAGTDNLWDGMWGLMRTYRDLQPDVAQLPNNPFNKLTAAMNPLKSDTAASPTPGQELGQPTSAFGPIAPGINRCPTGPGSPPIKSFTIQAWMAKDLVGAKGILYNKNFDFKDPAGIVYIDANDYAAITSLTKPLEPMVLRVNAGDCVQVTLQNKLPATVAEYDSWNEVPPIIPHFNFNQITTSNRVSLHPQLLFHDVTGSDGAAIGQNPDTTVGPGASIQYSWYAGSVVVNGSTTTFTPIEYGTTHLRDYGDVIKHSSHGAIGTLIVEPKNSTQTLVGGSNASADVKNSAGSLLFREFVINYQDDVTMQNKAGLAMKNFRAVDDPEETGTKAFNYRTEPLWARLGLPPETDLRTLNNQDYTNTLSSLFPNAGCGTTPCDPLTPIFTAKVGTDVRFRVLEVAGHPRQHGFSLFGHHWNFEPWTASSTVLGANPFTFEIGSQSGMGPTRHLNILTKAGGLMRITGDYLYRTQDSFNFSGGLWGIFRVTP